MWQTVLVKTQNFKSHFDSEAVFSFTDGERMGEVVLINIWNACLTTGAYGCSHTGQDS